MKVERLVLLNLGSLRLLPGLCSDVLMSPCLSCKRLESSMLSCGKADLLAPEVNMPGFCTDATKARPYSKTLVPKGARGRRGKCRGKHGGAPLCDDAACASMSGFEQRQLPG